MSGGDRLGLVVALSAETRALLGRGGWSRLGGRPIRRGRLDVDIDFLCARSGPGRERALAAARALVSEGVCALAVLGVSGGLQPGLEAGELVVAGPVFEAGDGAEERAWEADPLFADSLYEALKVADLPVCRGPVVTTSRPVLTAADKGALYRRSGALAVDMETAGVAQAAVEAGLPLIVMRAICDPSFRSLPRQIASVLDPEGGMRVPRLLGRVGRRPSLLRDLVRLRGDFSAALNALARGWQVLGETLPGHLCGEGRLEPDPAPSGCPGSQVEIVSR